MAILQALLAALMRSMGSILNTTFGWATLALFGRIPRNRQTALAVISFGSVLWLVALLGAIQPSVGTFLLMFITVPDSMKGWVRVVLVALAAMLPLAVGLAIRRVQVSGPGDPARASALRTMLSGYPYTLGFGLTLLFLLVLVPLGKMRDIVRKWATTHIPIIVAPEDYGEVLDVVQASLARRGLRTKPGPASWVLRLPTRVLSFFAGSVEGLVSEQMKVLRADDLEILLHPSDLVVRGRPEKTAPAASVLLECLIHTKAHLTWDAESHEIEDRLQAILRDTIAHGGRSVPAASERLKAVERDLRRSLLAYEEIEKLYRIKWQVETEVLRAARSRVA